jgi:polyisoprenoid-binding protein YceI
MPWSSSMFAVTVTCAYCIDRAVLVCRLCFNSSQVIHMSELPKPSFPEISELTAVQKGAYVVDTVHTRVGFGVSHMGFSSWTGDFTGVTGTLSLDPQHLERTQLSVSIPVASISTTNEIVDRELRGEKWLDAAAHPEIRFVSRKVTRRDDRRAQIEGDLTFHGVTRPVTLASTFNGAGVNPFSKTYTVGFDGAATLRRSEFGAGNLVPMIGDQVTLRIAAEFSKSS